MDDLTEVKLKVDGKASDGFLVRRLSLKEGICRIPTAELVLCTKGDAIRMDELETYVEKAAALEISRTDAATARRTTRWFSGMVTSVEGCGVVAQSRDGEVFEYRMTIQPRLVNLCYSRSGRNFIQTTALEAVRTILAGFDVRYQNAGLPESAKLKQDFFQRHESDYAFLMRILASCGLSYAFRTPDQTGRVTPPMMHVGTGNALPAASDFLCDGKAVLPSAFSCAALRTEGSYCRMDSWRMRKSIGVDSLEVGFTNRAGADVRGAAGAGDVRRMKMDEALFADSKQGEIERLVEEHLRKMRVPTAGWTGTTQCLEALPGNLLQVNHFYGRNSTEVVEALVFASTLDCTLPILPGESLFGEDDRVSMRIAIRCLAGTAASETVSSAAETASVAATAEAPDAATNGSAGIFGAGGGGGESAALFVKQAVVTDLSGKVDSTNAAVKFKPRPWGAAKGGVDYVFQAKSITGVQNGTANDDNPFEVNFIQPVGGYGQGLFRMPRVGDRILVLGVPSVTGVSPTYYLLGYLPGDEMPFTTPEELERKITSASEMSKDEAPPYQTALPEEMMALRFRTPGKKDEKVDLENKMGIRRAKLPNGCSELAFYNTHVGGGETKWDDKLEKWVYDDFSEDKDPVTKDPFNEERKVLANFQSTGNMQLSANHNLEMNARNLTFKGIGWGEKWVKSGDKWELPEAKVSFGDINKFVVEAKGAIEFKVGKSSVVIGNDGITIKTASRFANVAGPIDASVKLNPLSGVAISGLNCRVNGFMGASIGDGVGAGASFGSGNASISGANICQWTTPSFDLLKRETFAAATLGTEITSMFLKGKKHEESEKKALMDIACGQTALDTILAGKKTLGGCQKGKLFSEKGIEGAFKFVQSLIDFAMAVGERACCDTMNEPAAGQENEPYPITVRDAWRMAGFVAKTGAWLTVLGARTAEAVKLGPFSMEGTAMKLQYGEFSVECAKKDLLAKAFNQYNAVNAEVLAELSDLPNRVSDLEMVHSLNL